MNALLAIGYRLAMPVKPEEFAEAATREEWRRSKGMIVLKHWSDEHPRSPVFVDKPRAAVAQQAVVLSRSAVLR